MNYRDTIASVSIGSWVAVKVFQQVAQNDDNYWVMQHIYTDDESDVAFREVTNKTDAAVRRKHAIAYVEKIKMMRAERERAA